MEEEEGTLADEAGDGETKQSKAGSLHLSFAYNPEMVWDAQHAVKTESLKATLHPTHIFIFKRKRIDICISYSCIVCAK